MLDHALKLLEERAKELDPNPKPSPSPSPKPNPNPNWKELDPVEVLDVLPANMPIKQLRGFLDQAFILNPLAIYRGISPSRYRYTHTS